MNEFTKEELEYLNSCPSVRCNERLVLKIQFLIKSYDEYKGIAEKVMKKYDKALNNLKDR